MAPYQVYLHFDLLASIPTGGAKRRRIMEFVRALANQPHLPGDYADRDSIGRTRQIKIIENYAITYWVDEAVKTVMVVGACPADR